MDENKIAIVVYKQDDAAYENLMQQVSALKIPDIGGKSADVEIVTVDGDGGRAAAYNAAMRQSQARYKVYVDTSVAYLNPGLLGFFLRVFHEAQHAGMAGVYGSSLPLGGDYANARHRYGHCTVVREDGSVQQAVGDPGVFYQRVDAVDGTCLATCADVPWDEDIGEPFLATAHVWAMRAAHLRTYVPVIGDGAILCATTRMPAYFRIDDPAAYHFAQQQFVRRYAAALYPRVSIMIPAYNQPAFCRAALESILAQDYPSIEILIGDDSTDSRVRDAIAPLLAEHPDIRYEYRGGLPGENAGKNIMHLLNASTGAFVNLLFHDDLIYPTKISKMMAWFAEDLDDEIAFATSRRDSVDADGRPHGVFEGYGGAGDAVFTGRQLGRKMLLQQLNIVGEMSTVLLRKSLLWDGEKYEMGRFCGYQDPSMGDISTWMELLRDGHTCVYLHEPLSAFRTHPAQNTYNPDTMLLCYLDWLAFLVLARLHHVYLDTEEEFTAGCDEWRRRYLTMAPYLREKITPAQVQAFRLFEQALAAVGEKDYEQAAACAIRYMVTTGADPAVFLNGTPLASAAASFEKEGSTHAGQ